MNGKGTGIPGVAAAGRRCFVKTVSLMCTDAAEELLAESDMYSYARELQGKVIPWLVFRGVDIKHGPSGVRVLCTSKEGVALNRHEASEIVGKIGAATVAQNCRTALVNLHHHGIVHGDVAFRNFVVNESGGVRIIDLGRSRLISTIASTQRADLLQHERDLLENELASLVTDEMVL